jgi:acetolactate decarboxylase
MQTDKTSCDHVVSTALSQCLDKPLHTLFQGSTSAALVEGLYQGAVRVSRLLRHGDFASAHLSTSMEKWSFWKAFVTA